MNRISGVPGVFMYANEPKVIADWYTRHFGIEFLADIENTFYTEYYYRDDSDPSKRASSVFAIMPARTKLGAERGEYMMSYRVADLAGLLDRLKEDGQATQPVKEQYDGRYPESKGLFTWIHDPEGNRIELYQPL